MAESRTIRGFPADIGMNTVGVPRDGSDSSGIHTGMDSMDAYLTRNSADASDSDLSTYWSSKDKVWRKLSALHPAYNLRSSSLAGNNLGDQCSCCRLNLWIA